MSETIEIQRPEGAAQQLMLLQHGLGSTPQALLPLGQRLAQDFPHALVISVQAPQASDLGEGYQWFSVRGMTDESRPARVAEAMPAFMAMVHDWQRQSGVGPEATALIGFSQGAIMSLEATQRPELLVGRVVALSGRFATLPRAPHPHTTVHLVHGKSDSVIHYGYTVTGAERLIRLGADVTADVLPFLGHEINDLVVETLMKRLLGHVPQRYWKDLHRAAGGGDPPVS